MAAVRTKHTTHDPDVWAAIEALPPLGATDESQEDRPAVKLFDPTGSAFWIIWEYDPEQKLGFGYADLYGDGTFGELGYIYLPELHDSWPLKVPVEQDMMVTTLVEGYKSRNVTVPDYLVAANG